MDPRSLGDPGGSKPEGWGELRSLQVRLPTRRRAVIPGHRASSPSPFSSTHMRTDTRSEDLGGEGLGTASQPQAGHLFLDWPLCPGRQKGWEGERPKPKACLSASQGRPLPAPSVALSCSRGRHITGHRVAHGGQPGPKGLGHLPTCRPAASVSKKGGLPCWGLRACPHLLCPLPLSSSGGSKGCPEGKKGRDPVTAAFENLFGLGIWGEARMRNGGGRGCWLGEEGNWGNCGLLTGGFCPKATGPAWGGQISVDSMRSRREGVQAFFSSLCWGVGVLDPPAAPRSRSRRSSCWLRWYIST